MAVSAGTAYIDLRARLDSLERDLRSVDSRVARSAKQAEDRYTAMSKRMSGALKAAFATVGIAGVTRGVGFLVDQASNLNETMSFTEVTFKGASDTIKSWSESTLNAMGLSQQAALEAANQFGGLFQVTGSGVEEAANLSQEMTQLAVDMASAKNVRLEDAIAALGSGLRGEAEPMRRFNVLLSEAAIQEAAVRNGIAKTGQELTEGQKVQARYALIMEQTTDIQGDYARTSDSAANQTRRMQESVKEASAEIGQSLLPMLAAAAEKTADLTQGLSEDYKAAERQAESFAESKDLLELLAYQVQQGTRDYESFSETAHQLADDHASLADKFRGLFGPIPGRSEELFSFFEELDQKLKDNKEIAAPWAEETDEAADKVLTAYRVTTKATAEFAGMTGKKLDEWQSGTVGNFNLVKGALGELADKHKLTAEVILRQLRRAFTAQVEFGENWEIVNERAGEKGDEFLAYIQENYGAQAPAILDALKRSNDEDFNAIFSVWNKAQRHARTTSQVVSTELGDVGRELDTTRGKAIKLGNSWLTLVEALSGTVRANIQHGLDGGGGGFGPSMGITGVGQRLQQGGFRVSGHPAFPPVGRHTAGSYHYAGRAIDINWGTGGESPAEKQRLNAAGYALMASMGSRLKEIYFPAHDPVGGHQDHLHLAMDRGGVVRGPATIHQGAITEAHIPLSGPGAMGLRISGVLDIPGLGRAFLNGTTVAIDATNHRQGRIDRTRRVNVS